MLSSLLGWEGSIGLLEGGVCLLGDGGQIGALGDLVPVKVGVGVVGDDDRGSDVDVVVVVVDDGHMGSRDLDGGGDNSCRHMDVVVRGSGDNNGGRSHSCRALVGADGGGGAGLVGPGVGKEPC